MCGEATPGKRMGCPRLRKRDVKQYKTTATVYQECTVVNQKTAGRVADRSRHGGDAPSRQLAQNCVERYKFCECSPSRASSGCLVYRRVFLSLSSVPAGHYPHSLPVLFPGPLLLLLLCSSQRTNPREIRKNAKQS